jgi:Tol biopolymer transport system component
MLFPEAQQPALSVDGTKLTYVHLNAGIHVHDLTTEQALHAITNDRAVAPTLSPDNHRLAYSEYELTWWYGWHKTNAKLMIANADGSDRAAALFGLRPAWSPVNNLIVYEACEGATCGLYILNVDNASTRILVGESAGKASWSPDGQRITYSTAEDGDAETWVINLDGTGAKKLTDNRSTDAMASWSPDGQHIYFLSDREGGWAIWVMHPDGTGQRKVRSIGVPSHWEWVKLSVGWNR